ncbi:TonB-dependent receptor [Porticoccaceae bacterium]|nr:TonB-dependent receptor [Porticoccaceae bacterium]
MASSADPKRYQLRVEAQNIEQALRSLANASGKRLLFPYDQVGALKSVTISGRYTLEDALKIILKDTSLSGRLTSDGVILITPDQKKSDRGSEMNSKKRILASTIAFFMGAGGVSGVVGAEDVDSKEMSWLLEEVIVTAQKREQKLIDVPMSVAALTGEDLENQGVVDLQSLSLAVPGLFVAESGSFQRRISIRGIGNTNGSSSLVGLYLDEAPVASLPASQIDLRVYDLERIEVLKGPQGTLYGEGSVGGTIRYITQDPQLDAFGGAINIDGSTTERGDTSHTIKGVVNTPITDTLGLRLVGQYINSGGWIDQPALGKKDINDYELFNVRGKLLWQPTDDLEIKATAIVHRNDAGADNVGEDEEGNYHQAFDDPSTPEVTDDYDLFNLLVNYELGGLSLMSSTSYLDSDKQITNWGGQCCGPIDALFSTLFASDKSSAEVLTQEFRVSSSDAGAWHWSAGLFYKDATTSPFDAKDVRFGTFLIPGFWQENSFKSWAIFGETSYELTDKWELGVGLRYFEDDREFQGGRTESVQKETFDSVNPKFYLSYQTTEDVHLYANASKGFRSGGFNSLGVEPYDPENVWSYELGSKLSAMDGRLNTELAFFYSTYEDYQILAVPPGMVLASTFNAGEAELKGLDLSFKFLAAESFELGLTANYTDTEFTKINGTFAPYAKGDPLDLASEYGVSVWSHYTFDWPSNTPGFLRIDYSQRGESHYRNRTNGPGYHGTSDVIKMLNARLGWEADAWSAELYALNLLDENGFISPFHIELLSPRPRPRTIGLNIGYRF